MTQTDDHVLDAELRQEYCALVEQRAGIRLNAAQLRSLDTLISDLLQRLHRPLTPAQLYRAFAVGDLPNLFDDFAAQLTIGETHFFRVTPQIKVLRESILPDLYRHHATSRKLRCWSAGCATGEEPYTLAILLNETLPDLPEWKISLLATDLSEPALLTARRAVFRSWSFRATPTWVQQRYFKKIATGWQLNETVRQQVQFKQLNLLADTWPPEVDRASSIDLILCRNVTIYFGPEARQRLYQRFAQVLAPGGWLVLGPSDPIPHEVGFVPVYHDGAISWRLPASGTDRAQGPDRNTRSDARLRMPMHQSTDVSTVRPSVSPRTTSGVVVAAPTRQAPSLPVTPEAALVQIQRQIAAGEQRAAQQALDALVQRAPLLEVAHRLQGLLALDAGAYQQAIESLRRATFLNSRDPLAQLGLGRAYQAAGDPARARTALRQARRLLGALPAEQAIPGEDGVSVGQLQQVVTTLLAAVGEPGGTR